MHVRACIVKTAQYKASGEEGKYSEAYRREATVLLVHPDDMVAWQFKEGMHVACSNQEKKQAVILAVKQTRNVRKGMVNIIASPWTACLLQDDRRFVDLDVEPSTEEILPLDQLLSIKRPGAR
ncbi:MAG: molybdopterin dinucleotide binding domain-containing protein [Candidatus Sigynarchaeota archaeon]